MLGRVGLPIPSLFVQHECSGQKQTLVPDPSASGSSPVPTSTTLGKMLHSSVPRVPVRAVGVTRRVMVQTNSRCDVG